MKAHLRYLARHSADAELEDHEGMEFLGTPEEMARLVQEWNVSTAEPDSKEGQRAPVAALHIVLSMPKGTDPQAVFDAARGFSDEELSNHRYLLVMHKDQDHPHVHVVVNNVGYDLRPLKRSREDLQRMREVFARELRARGVSAEATPRRARGVVAKAIDRKVPILSDIQLKRRGSSAARKLQLDVDPVTGEVKYDFGRARVMWSKVEAAENELRGYPRERHVAEDRARANRALADRVFGDALASLQQQGRAGSEVAAVLTDFLRSMPAPNTELDNLKHDLRSGRLGEAMKELLQEQSSSAGLGKGL